MLTSLRLTGAMAYVAALGLGIALISGCYKSPAKYPDPPPIKAGLWRETVRTNNPAFDNPNFEPTFEKCVGEGAAPITAEMRSAVDAAKNNCQTTDHRGSDGSFITDVTCDFQKIHMSLHAVDAYPTATHTHERAEFRTAWPLPWLGSTTWNELDSTYVGPCPAGLGPGQRLLPNGFIVDSSRLARGHFTLGAPQVVVSTGAGMGPSPPVTPAPLAPVSSTRRAYVSCVSSGNGTKWGSLKFDQTDYPFGSGNQTWRVRAKLSASASGEHELIWEIESRNDKADFFDAEPNYTVRLGTSYSFTPPIAQQDHALGHGGAPLTIEAAQTREAAQKRAKATGDTYCYVTSCFPSEYDTQAFVQAFDAAAAVGGDLTISGPGPNGPITLRYPLRGLDGIWARLERCAA